MNGYTNGPASLEAVLEEYKIQPNIRWMKVSPNDLPPSLTVFVIVLFNDGTVIVDLAEDIDWLGAVAFGYVSYSH